MSTRNPQLVITRAVLVLAVLVSSGMAFYTLAYGSIWAFLLALAGQQMVCYGVIQWRPRDRIHG